MLRSRYWAGLRCGQGLPEHFEQYHRPHLQLAHCGRKRRMWNWLPLTAFISLSADCSTGFSCSAAVIPGEVMTRIDRMAGSAKCEELAGMERPGVGIQGSGSPKLGLGEPWKCNAYAWGNTTLHFTGNAGRVALPPWSSSFTPAAGSAALGTLFTLRTFGRLNARGFQFSVCGFAQSTTFFAQLLNLVCK